MADFQVPIAFRFKPTDEELIGLFLYKMVVQKGPLMPPYDRIFHRCDLFGNLSEPSQIWENYRGGGGDHLCDEHLYFLCELKRKGSNIIRKIGSGTWSEGPANVDVKVKGNPNPIGTKRVFRFENGKKTEDHTAWLLDEYSLFDATAVVRKDRTSTRICYDFDFVICRLRRNDRSAGIGNRRKGNSAPSHDQSKERNQPTNKRTKKDPSKDQKTKRRTEKKSLKQDHQPTGTIGSESMNAINSENNHGEEVPLLVCSPRTQSTTTTLVVHNESNSQMIACYDDADPLLFFAEDMSTFNLDEFLAKFDTQSRPQLLELPKTDEWVHELMGF